MLSVPMNATIPFILGHPKTFDTMARTSKQPSHEPINTRLLGGATLSVIGVVAVVLLFVSPGYLLSSTPDVGDPAPDFTVATSDGGEFTLSQQKGNVVVVEFMAIYCSVCRNQQVPALIDLQEELANESVIIVSVTTKDDDTAGELEQYKQDTGAMWPHGLYDSEAKDDYGAIGTPTMAVVDSEGELAFIERGFVGKDELTSVIEPLL